MQDAISARSKSDTAPRTDKVSPKRDSITSDSSAGSSETAERDESTVKQLTTFVEARLSELRAEITDNEAAKKAGSFTRHTGYEAALSEKTSLDIVFEFLNSTSEKELDTEELHEINTAFIALYAQRKLAQERGKMLADDILHPMPRREFLARGEAVRIQYRTTLEHVVQFITTNHIPSTTCRR